MVMSAERLELRIDCRNELGETPAWCAGSTTLYWIDVVKPGRVFYWQTETDLVDFWDFDDLVTGLNLVAQGGLLVHGACDIFLFDPASRAQKLIFSLPDSAIPMRFNDGHCDHAGRLWVGSMPDNLSKHGAIPPGYENSGQLYVVGAATTNSFDVRLGCPNAICWSPDGGTFYIADSCDGWLYAYRFDAAQGTVSKRRPFFRLDDCGIPDGAAVDCDGYIWNARWDGGAVVRISPDGRLDRIVHLPTSRPTACCFGGMDRKTLYVTSARFGLTPGQLKTEPFAGGIFTMRVDVPGIEIPSFHAPESIATADLN